MLISERQLHVLVRVLEGSLSFNDRNDMNWFGYDRDVRFNIYNEIVNQKSTDLVAIGFVSEKGE